MQKKPAYLILITFTLFAFLQPISDTIASLKSQINQLLAVLGDVPATPPSALQTTFPGCSNLSSVGSPILLINQANDLISELMHSKDPNTSVKYLHFSKDEAPSKFSTIFTLVFRIASQGGEWFLGLQLDAVPVAMGMAGVNFKKFILTQTKAMALRVLGLQQLAGPPAGYDCGDQKFIFSSYGNDAGALGQGVGFNRNRAPKGLFDALKKLKNSDLIQTYRSCEADTFLKSRYFYFVAATPADPKPTFPVSIPQTQPFELAKCSPEDVGLIKGLEFNCQSDTPSGFAAKLVGLRVFYNVPFRSQGEIQAFGKQTPAVGPNFQFIQFVDLAEITRIDAFYIQDNASVSFRFYSGKGTDNLMGVFNCGNTLGFTSDQPSDTVEVEKLLGFWGAVATGPNQPLRALGFMKFK